jgi:hypothetical protein
MRSSISQNEIDQTGEALLNPNSDPAQVDWSFGEWMGRS